jgi:ergothioneine biosynthesis protein EgtB
MAMQVQANPMATPLTTNGATSPHESLIEQYQQVRRFSEHLCEPLVTEDYVIQSMPDVSPTKWHLAHTSWFFETFVLTSAIPGYTSLHPQYTYLFNSYYNAVGEKHCRAKRGLISRPTVEETYQYRAYVDQHMLELLAQADEPQLAKLAPIVIIGLHHEQQHQELMLTDIKHVLSCNPLLPVYQERPQISRASVPPLEWVSYPEGVYWIGHEGDGFAYDNEGPRHRQFVQPFRLASRLVTNGEYLKFMEDGGYRRPELWLSAGWNTVQESGWDAPFYWEQRDGRWYVMTLSGMREVDEAEPVCHVSYYEADAFARWADARLPTEAEWEVAAADVSINGNFAESGQYHPVPLNNSTADGKLSQMFGDVWEWTQSPYTAYPGYKPAPGALGEYNGKFMCNQFVLRGGSCATSSSHIRRTYRNFFQPEARWQFMGIRLAKDV